MLKSVSLLWYLSYFISENTKKTALAGLLFMLGFSQEVRQLNSYLSKMRTDLYLHAEKLKDLGQPLTAVSLKESYLGLDKPSKMLLEILQEHNDQVESLVRRVLAKERPNAIEQQRATWVKICKRNSGKRIFQFNR